MDRSTPQEVPFTHDVLEGTAYEVGRQQGEMLKHDPQRATYLTPVLPFLEAFSRHEAHRALAYFDQYCPGIGDEIQGAADAFGVSLEEIAFLGGKNKENGSSAIPVDRPVGGSHCSHFAVLTAASQDGHLRVGQNVDCGPGDLDLRLCTTRVRGKAAHIGFSDMIFGRTEGMNEHGLCVTTSWGAPGLWLKGEGLPYFAVVRALLDRCQTVDQTLDLLAELPIAWCTNYIVTDRRGETALIEVAYEHRGVRRIGPRSQEPFLWATNHYTLPAMKPHDARRMRQSVVRHKAIESRLRRAAPQITQDAIRGILSEPMPGGACTHHYSSGLGTLWSMVFDLTDITVEVCFGAPDSERNAWRSFDLWDPAGQKAYAAHLPDEPAKPEIWQRLPPGGELP
jgi:predicted choloylglycine hydrolase